MHTPVLLDDVLDLLAPRPGDVAVDATLGGGGHAAALARAVRAPDGGGRDGRVVGFDLDPAAVEHGRRCVEAEGVRFDGFPESFVRIEARLAALAVRADVVLADLGYSSLQMDDPRRGLSFRADGPLDMRLDPRSTTTAADIVATWSEEALADAIRDFGEEPLARKIAQKLVRTREREPIDTTARLARLVLDAYGPRARHSRMHPATRTFMALRIAVNNELDALHMLLESITRAAEAARSGGWLNAGARVAIISFHSLEDRIVKRAFADLADRGLATRLTRKPITAAPSEIDANRRARSAKLRAVRIGDPLPA